MAAFIMRSNFVLLHNYHIAPNRLEPNVITEKPKRNRTPLFRKEARSIFESSADFFDLCHGAKCWYTSATTTITTIMIYYMFAGEMMVGKNGESCFSKCVLENGARANFPHYSEMLRLTDWLFFFLFNVVELFLSGLWCASVNQMVFVNNRLIFTSGFCWIACNDFSVVKTLSCAYEIILLAITVFIFHAVCIWLFKTGDDI